MIKVYFTAWEIIWWWHISTRISVKVHTECIQHKHTATGDKIVHTLQFSVCVFVISVCLWSNSGIYSNDLTEKYRCGPVVLGCVSSGWGWGFWSLGASRGHSESAVQSWGGAPGSATHTTLPLPSFPIIPWQQSSAGSAGSACSAWYRFVRHFHQKQFTVQGHVSQSLLSAPSFVSYTWNCTLTFWGVSQSVLSKVVRLIWTTLNYTLK